MLCCFEGQYLFLFLPPFFPALLGNFGLLHDKVQVFFKALFKLRDCNGMLTSAIKFVAGTVGRYKICVNCTLYSPVLGMDCSDFEFITGWF